MTALKYRAILESQVELLIKWNNENTNSDPEQVRENVHLILSIIQYLSILDARTQYL